MQQKPNPNSQKPSNFYLEIPFQESLATDYPSDVEIQHAYDDPEDHRGLSSEQVSALAQDALEEAKSRHESVQDQSSAERNKA